MSQEVETIGQRRESCAWLTAARLVDNLQMISELTTPVFVPGGRAIETSVWMCQQILRVVTFQKGLLDSREVPFENWHPYGPAYRWGPDEELTAESIRHRCWNAVERIWRQERIAAAQAKILNLICPPPLF